MVQKIFSIIFQFTILPERFENIFDAVESGMFQYFLKTNSTKKKPVVIVAPPSVLENIAIRGTFTNGRCIKSFFEAKKLYLYYE